MEVITMNVEKVIRILGYIVYTALWSPVIVIGIVVLPIVWLAMHIRAGLPIRGCVKSIKNLFVTGIQHDMEFIRTGKWT